MKRPEETRRTLVQEWLDKSREDLGVADYLLRNRSPYLNAIGFHAQQGAEKALKALLVRHQVEFPKTHNLGELLDLVARVAPVLAGTLRAATGLNPYGVDARYPGDLPHPTGEDAAQAVRLASQVRDAALQEMQAYLEGKED
jgi:HEPN domain-containing protein